jgi:hypothetical protein
MNPRGVDKQTVRERPAGRDQVVGQPDVMAAGLLDVPPNRRERRKQLLLARLLRKEDLDEPLELDEGPTPRFGEPVPERLAPLIRDRVDRSRPPADVLPARPGDFVYIPAGIPHLPANASSTEPAVAVLARTDANEQESAVALPELDGLQHLVVAGRGPFDGTIQLVRGLVGRDVGYVDCAPGFARNAAVVDGFSDLIVELWEAAGRHARSAPGQGPSPLDVPIIIDAIVAVA